MAAADAQEHEQISEALEVEQLDVNLYRSKTLYLPVRARGVFGGQVISQALVAATGCVDPAYGLHVRPCRTDYSCDIVLTYILATQQSVSPCE